MRYMMASIMPHARLEPREPTHLAHIRLAGAAHTQRTGESKHHDDSAKHLQHAVDGVQHPLKSRFKHEELPFQHGLKESLRARDSKSDLTFAKFHDEEPQFVRRSRIHSP